MTEPIHPPATGITPEAAEALGIPPDDPRVVIDSDAIEVDDYDGGISDPFPALNTFGAQGDAPLSDGDTIDGAIAGDVSGGGEGEPRTSPPPRQRISRLHSGPNWNRSDEAPRDATTKPPSLDEWTTFFGKVVLRITCDWYLSYAFRGIDEEILSDREIERLAMTDEERKTIAVPLAEFSSKSKFMRKHGRSIVAAGDSFNALVVLGAWMSRVNRIAGKYRPKVHRMRMNGANGNGSSGQSPAEAEPATYGNGTAGGRVPNGYPVYRSGGG